MFVPPMARASVLFRCESDGETRSACCCPPAARHHTTPADTGIRSACCCKITHFQSHESSVRAAAPTMIDLAPWMLPVVLLDVHVETRAVAAVIAYAHAPRGPPEPLFVRHCSLLL